MSKAGHSKSMTAKIVGIGPGTLKKWTEKFSNLIQPIKDEKGNIRYREEDLDILKNIARLTKERGFTLDGAYQEMSKDKSKGIPVKQTQAINKLKRVRSFLVDMKQRM